MVWRMPASNQVGTVPYSSKTRATVHAMQIKAFRLRFCHIAGTFYLPSGKIYKDDGLNPAFLPPGPGLIPAPLLDPA